MESGDLIDSKDRRFSLNKREKIRRRANYVKIYRYGRRYNTKHFTLIVSHNEEDFSRLGISASKKIGNAVRRNRVKRILREIFRRNKSLLAPFRDYVFVAKKRADELTYREALDEIKPFLTH